MPFRLSPHAITFPLLAALAAGCAGGPVELIDEDGDGWYANDPDERKVDCDDEPERGENSFPGAPEICDGLDNDCDGNSDEADARDAVEFWPDEDGDGFGVRVDDPIIGCTPPDGWVANRRDCNDDDDEVYPNAPERCNGRDDNCNNQVDEGVNTDATWYNDADGDGFGRPSPPAGTGCKEQPNWVLDNTDCNDARNDIYPGAPEVCDQVDADCDGLADDDDPDVTDGVTWWIDADGDTYGDLLKEIIACGDAPGRADNPDDCDDSNDKPNPDPVSHLDADWDGHGDPDTTFGQTQCIQPIGYVRGADDCDDGDPNAWEGSSWYTDGDGDGFGSGTPQTTGCGADPALVDNGDDCDDGDENVFPGADEICNMGVDDDCDGAADDDDPEGPIGAPTWYVDGDGDGFGIFVNTLRQCAQPEGYADNRDDCNDKDATRGSGAPWYRDADRDGFGDPDDACGVGCQPLPGCVQDASDCDDGDYYNNADAQWYDDLDGDGVGVGEAPVANGCLDDTTDLAALPGDCDDSDDVGAVDPFCVGPGFADIRLVITVDAAGATGTVTLNCDGADPLEVVLDAGDADTSFTADLDDPVEEGAACVLDATGVTGTATFTAEACGAFLASGGAGDTDAATADVRCNGCTDPAAINLDPTARIETDASSCLYR